MKTNDCVYCSLEKQVKIMELTGEYVCFECRIDLLKMEFEDSGYSLKEIDNTIMESYFN